MFSTSLSKSRKDAAVVLPNDQRAVAPQANEEEEKKTKKKIK